MITYTTVDVDTHLAVLMTALKYTVCQWRELGVQLGVSYFKLEEIYKNRKEVKEYMMDMLVAWLTGQGGECTKRTLKTALLNIDCSITD